MIKHLCKLVWNRKRSSFLMIVEIFFSFLVLFAVVTLGAYYVDNYNQPLGYTYENVWNVGIDMNQTSDDYWSPEQVGTVNQLYLTARSFDEVEAIAGALSVPYDFGGRSSGMEVHGKRIETGVNEVTEDFKEVMGLQLVAGRWFEKADDALNWQPVVINQKFSKELFGDEDPVDKRFEPWSSDNNEIRVIGVVTDFRQGGEYAGLDYYMFERKKLDDPQQRPPRNLLIKVRPGTTAAFEEKLAERLQAVAKDWSFEIQPIVQKRESALKLRLAPVIAAGVVAAFLMIMVGLGLVGVLWQSVTQRTREIGLRRAKGATLQHVYKQILGELFVLTSIGLIIGVIVVVQFPLLDLIGIQTKVFGFGLVISLVLIYALTLAAGLYPSWLATKVQPAEALHYE
ncbi:ABC transporter permease [candidate division KSB1 bacterium]|nr:ABC transporter permease [candidate division KSB1 bacterium]